MMQTDMNRPHVLLIYTGGTIGMRENIETGALENFNFDLLLEEVPELVRFDYSISTITFDPPIDSSDMGLEHWSRLVRIIENNYHTYDGFVILHGTDTMAYTASALSFMLENIGKPVILTGSQLPIGTLRTDGKENLITAIEMAAAKRADGSPMVPEVCIYFKEKLLRGNRTTKINAEQFNAFRSFAIARSRQSGHRRRAGAAAGCQRPSCALWRQRGGTRRELSYGCGRKAGAGWRVWVRQNHHGAEPASSGR